MDLSKLIEIVNSEVDSEDRRSAVIQIGQIGTKPAYDFLLSICDDSVPLIAGIALHWISEIHLDSRAFDALIDKINSNDPVIRSFAAKGLGNTEIYSSVEDRRKAIESLLKRAEFDSDDGVQMYSLMSLGKLRALVAIEKLKRMLERERNPEVYRQILITLNELR